MLNNTVYYYNVTACKIDDGSVCNSTSGSFTTLQTNLTAGPTPTPVATVGASPTPTPSTTPVYWLYGTIINSGLDASNLIPQGAQLLLKITVQNKGNRDTKFDLHFTERATSAAAFRRIASLFSRLIHVGETLSFEESIPTSGWLNGSHELLPEILLSGAIGKTEHGPPLTIQITEPIQAPYVIPGSVYANPTTSSVTITWDTDEPSTGWVNYGLDNLASLIKESGSAKKHKVEIRNLEKGKTYRFKITVWKGTSNSVYPESGYLTFETATDASKVCEAQNYCAGSVFYRMVERNGTCVAESRTGKLCRGTGCLNVLCDNYQGCIGLEDNSKCTESCTNDTLKVRPVCVAGGADNLAGTCEYSEFKCEKQTLCQPAPVTCNGRGYICIKTEKGFVWSTSDASCKGYIPNSIDFAEEPTGRPVPVLNMTETPGFSTGSDYGLGIGRENIIEAQTYIAEPDIISDRSQARVYVVTNSQKELISIRCVAPPDTGICSCSPGFQQKNTNFKCTMDPKVSGNYTIYLKNSQGDGGALSVVMTPGKPAEVRRILQQDNEKAITFQLLVAVCVFLISVAAGSMIYRKRKERVLGKKLEDFLQFTVPRAQEELKIKFMKGEIKDKDFGAANKAWEEKKAEATARLQEWKKRHGKDARIGPAPQESTSKEQEKAPTLSEIKAQASQSKFEGMKSAIEEPKPQVKEKEKINEGNPELDSLLDALQKKKPPENAGGNG